MGLKRPVGGRFRPDPLLHQPYSAIRRTCCNSSPKAEGSCLLHLGLTADPSRPHHAATAPPPHSPSPHHPRTALPAPPRRAPTHAPRCSAPRAPATRLPDRQRGPSPGQSGGTCWCRGSSSAHVLSRGRSHGPHRTRPTSAQAASAAPATAPLATSTRKRTHPAPYGPSGVAGSPRTSSQNTRSCDQTTDDGTPPHPDMHDRLQESQANLALQSRIDRRCRSIRPPLRLDSEHMFATSTFHLPAALRRAVAWVRAFAFLEDRPPAVVTARAPAPACHGATHRRFLQPPVLPDRRPRTAPPVQPCTVAGRGSAHAHRQSLAHRHPCMRPADHEDASV